MTKKISMALALSAAIFTGACAGTQSNQAPATNSAPKKGAGQGQGSTIDTKQLIGKWKFTEWSCGGSGNEFATLSGDPKAMLAMQEKEGSYSIPIQLFFAQGRAPVQECDLNVKVGYAFPAQGQVAVSQMSTFTVDFPGADCAAVSQADRKEAEKQFYEMLTGTYALKKEADSYTLTRKDAPCRDGKKGEQILKFESPKAPATPPKGDPKKPVVPVTPTTPTKPGDKPVTPTKPADKAITPTPAKAGWLPSWLGGKAQPAAPAKPAEQAQPGDKAKPAAQVQPASPQPAKPVAQPEKAVQAEPSKYGLVGTLANWLTGNGKPDAADAAPQKAEKKTAPAQTLKPAAEPKKI